MKMNVSFPLCIRAGLSMVAICVAPVMSDKSRLAQWFVRQQPKNLEVRS